MEKNWQGNFDAKFEDLKGKIITEIKGAVGDSTMTFRTSDIETFQMHYYKDCCAHCSVEDICGDLKDLIGSPILLAEEVSNSDPEGEILEKRKAAYEKEKSEFVPSYSGDTFDPYGPNPSNDWKEESETWTFYKLSTIKGSVTIRWYGSSNGYYSESVTFERLAS